MILTPNDFEWQAQSHEMLIAVLQDLKFIGERLINGSDCYLLGDDFLQQVIFLGCSPAIELMPPDSLEVNDAAYWKGFSFVYIPTASSNIECHIDMANSKPRCSDCGKRVKDWQQHTEYEHSTAMNKLSCPFCSHKAMLCEWDWRQDGSCAKQFIHVVNIYPQEAIPTETFYSKLNAATSTQWSHAYCSTSISAINKLLDS